MRSERPRAGPAAALQRQLSDPLARNAFALVGSNLASAVLGLVFWVAAARIYSTSNVGIDTALISAMGLLANIAMLNLTNAFNRFVPTAGTRTGRLVGFGYLLTGTLSVAAAAVFVVGVKTGWWAPELEVVFGRHFDQYWFVIATLIWTIFTLQDAVLTGLGDAPWVLIENVGYGLLKLILLIAVAQHLPRTGVFIAWTGPLIVFVLAVNFLLFSRLIPKRRSPPGESINPRVVGRFVSADYPASLMIAVTIGLMPLLALTITGTAKSSAYVYLSWTFAYTLHLVSTNVGMSMITEAARSPERLVEYARKTVTHALRIVIPLAAVLIIAAPYVLRIEGADYATHATHLLQLFALAAIPSVFVTTYLNIMRVERRMAAVLGVTAIQSVAIVVPSIVMLHIWGIVGIGIAWLGTQTVLAVALLCGEMRTLWLPLLPSRSLRAILDSSPVPQQRTEIKAARQRALEKLASSGLAAQGWQPKEYVAHMHDVGVLRVTSTRPAQEGLFKVATSAIGLDSLHREISALQTVRDAAPPEIDGILPRVLEFDASADRAWMLESRGEGVDARGALGSPVAIEGLLADITERMCALYRVRMAPLTVDDDAFTRLVELPLEAIRTLRTSQMRTLPDSTSLAKIREELDRDLAGRRLVMSLIHGDLWLGNVLCDPEFLGVRGIIDWHCATVAFPSVDIVHLICTTRALSERREFGSIVRELLGSAPLRPNENALLESLPGANEISLRTSVLLAWLRHISDDTRRGKRLTRNLWLTHNVHAVLENLNAYHAVVQPADVDQLGR